MRKITLALTCLFAQPLWAGDIVVTDAFARVARPGAPTGAVFMTLHNEGSVDDRLIGASTPLAQIAQIHTHIDDNGIMRMREVKDGIPLAAGGLHLFQRGGDHVMLMGITEDLADGDMVSLTLHFEGIGDMTLEVPVDNQRGQETKAKSP